MKGKSLILPVGGSVALHDLLGAEEVSDSEGAHGVTFDLLSGRERPAGSAIALVLHRSGVNSYNLDFYFKNSIEIFSFCENN